MMVIKKNIYILLSTKKKMSSQSKDADEMPANNQQERPFETSEKLILLLSIGGAPFENVLLCPNNWTLV